ncbi:MAG TPA: glycoside hydrolase family 2 TIM barrel-domain containing protein [Candidatus Limnocylindrales bacterium]|nr:glycoside hydrolase family 2 TIM barrel-domain containing protein [Candidatus Limnocylindrales bacterium]
MVSTTSHAPRATLSLDGEWQFIADPERLYRADDLPSGESIHVPGCWEAQVSRPYRIITAWYRRSFDLPPDWQGSRVVLRFGAVMYSCIVFLNGREIGRHEGGYTAIELDADGAVRYDEPNDLVVRVVNPLNGIEEYPAFSVEEVLLAQEFEPDLPLSEAPHGKQTWYSSQSGLWQSVSIDRRPVTSVRSVRVRPDVPGGAADIRWSLDGAGADPAPDALHLTVLDPDGAQVGAETVELRGSSSGSIGIPIPEARLWDIGQPNLYRVEARLLRGNEVTDELGVRFGMRQIETRDGRILLNGRAIYLLGALDQDLYPDTISTPPSREYLDEQVRLAQEMGLNLLRCHIKVPDPAYLDAADEAGILVWCELPNWTKFSTTSASRGRNTLERMVETLDNHPSIVIWTIINEDWGTQLRYEARDRHWLREMYDWLKALDPSRLVVDNSACETPQTPNFHLRTDLADFHAYFLPPDNAVRWRNMIEDFSRRPNWLWSPHGDAEPRGDEPLVLSEFGSWGLPRLDRLIQHHRREPWWFRTGRHYYRPTGLGRRFVNYGLDRIWPTVDDLAEATQWHQFDGLQYEIGQLRRHDSVQGYVITELTDAYWEANGLLDAMRGPKAYHSRLAALNAPDVLVADLSRRDLCSAEPLRGEVYLSSYGPTTGSGRVTWELLISDGQRVAGELAVESWPEGGATSVGWIDADIPDVTDVCDAQLILRAFDSDGRQRAFDEMRLAVLPFSSRRTTQPVDIAVHDPLDIWGVAGRVRALGHNVVPESRDALVIATEITDRLRAHLDAGGRALVLVRNRSAIPDDHDLTRRIAIHLRRLPHSGWPGQRSPWEGDWVTSWSWIDHAALPGLPARNPLDFAYEEVLPDHVLLGYDPVRHRDEVPAGMFVGWVHAPAAVVWSFRQGRGAVTVTTFRVAPESGPVATLLLERLIQQAASVDRRDGAREGDARRVAAVPELAGAGERRTPAP